MMAALPGELPLSQRPDTIVHAPPPSFRPSKHHQLNGLMGGACDDGAGCNGEVAW